MPFPYVVFPQGCEIHPHANPAPVPLPLLAFCFFAFQTIKTF